ncbi:MAG: peptidylprolyl isomerase [Oscillospiraceae bacterium]|nr:peptidylprolyl isomerase [Oscillospiraceae bacterium]
MSASSKKKLRNAEQAEKMTEKQLAEQKEAKKLKLYTTLAVVILIALVVFAAYIGISRSIANSGVRERNTVALTIGEETISNAEFNYFFIDAVNKFYSDYGAYASILGLDTTKPLDEQILNEETKETWADDFINSAVENAKAIYALVNEAKANGYTLPEEATTEIDNTMATMEMYATVYGYPDFESYLKAMYGNGATKESLRAYFELSELASHYQNHYVSSLTYSDADLRAAESEDFNKYSSYNYNYYYLSVNDFLDGESAEATDKQRAAAEKQAEETAKALAACSTVEEFDAAIAALPMNSELTDAASYASKNVAKNTIYSGYADWVTDEARKAGDTTYIASTSTSTDDNGNSVEQVGGYYVVMFGSKNDNNFAMSNVRHILVTPEGGTYNSTTGLYDYTDEEKAAALEEAEAILNEWKAGDATEDSFATLANEKSDDGDGTTGGLYEDINPSTSFVTSFKDWALADHETGDTEIVWSEYGYHIMFYSGDSETTYRDYLIANELRENDYTEWFTALTEAISVTEESFKHIRTDLVLSAS